MPKRVGEINRDYAILERVGSRAQFKGADKRARDIAICIGKAAVVREYYTLLYRAVARSFLSNCLRA